MYTLCVASSMPPSIKKHISNSGQLISSRGETILNITYLLTELSCMLFCSIERHCVLRITCSSLNEGTTFGFVLHFMGFSSAFRLLQDTSIYTRCLALMKVFQVSGKLISKSLCLIMWLSVTSLDQLEYISIVNMKWFFNERIQLKV